MSERQQRREIRDERIGRIGSADACALLVIFSASVALLGANVSQAMSRCAQ